MQLFVLLSAVLLSAQAATVPPVIIHKVSVPLPGNILASIPGVETEVPAVVVEVAKDHQHNPDAPVSHLTLTTEGLVASTTLPEVVTTTTVQTVVDEVVPQVVGQADSEPSEGSGQEVTATTTNPSVVEATTESKGFLGVVSDVVQAIGHAVTSVFSNEPETTVVPEVEAKDDVTTVVPEEVETTSQPLDDVTTVVPEDEETTSQPLGDVTTVLPEEEEASEQPLGDVTTVLPEEVVVTVRAISEVSFTSVDNIGGEKSTVQSSDDSSEEDPRDLPMPDVLNPLHNKEEGTVPHITLSPPIIDDLADRSSSSSSTSSEEDEGYPTIPKVPLQRIDEVVARHRRALPFSDKSHLATAKPKLTTDSKVIANILAKTKKAKRDVVAQSDDDLTAIDPCDLLCTKFEIEPICASNRICLYEFPNQCIMDTYNCKHPKQKFKATRGEHCLMNSLEFCSESEMV